MKNISLLLFFFFFTNSFSQSVDKVLLDTLADRLDSIYNDDQEYRSQIDSVGKKYGWKSNEVLILGRKLHRNDSINIVKVTKIIDQYGWLGTNEVGVKGNTALFLVIQHSGQSTLEKYLPVFRNAVKNKKAEPKHLALLEDRIAILRGKKQIYGSQISGVPGDYFIMPLKDPKNVDKRRASVGLPPIEEYLKQWDIKWNTERCKKKNNK